MSSKIEEAPVSDAVRFKKLRKKIEKGDCNSIELYRECVSFEPPIRGLPEIIVDDSVQRDREQASWDLDSSELRGVLSSLLLGHPKDLPKALKIRNRSFIRSVTVVHISNWENEVDGVAESQSVFTPLHQILNEINAEEKVLKGQDTPSTFSPLYGIRVSKNQESPIPLPYRLLTIPIEKGENPSAPAPETSLHQSESNVKNGREMFSQYLIPHGVLQMWAYPWPLEESLKKGGVGTLLARRQQKKVLNLDGNKKGVDQNKDRDKQEKDLATNIRDRSDSFCDSVPDAKRFKHGDEKSKDDAESTTSMNEKQSELKENEVLDDKQSFKDPALHNYGLYQEYAPDQEETEAICNAASSTQDIFSLSITFEGKNETGWSETEKSGSYVYSNICGSNGKSPLFFPVIAIDCEMCLTGGPSKENPDAKFTSNLTRLTLVSPPPFSVDSDSKEAPPIVLADVYVRPKDDAVITDYLTQYSGVTEQIMTSHNTLSFRQAQLLFLRLVTAETYLIGHSLDNDLKSLEIVHRNCLDSAILYPHPKGFPLRYKLRQLAKDHLKINIQNNDKHAKEFRAKKHKKERMGAGSIIDACVRDQRFSQFESNDNSKNSKMIATEKVNNVGHDSVEDAITALRLIQLKAKNGPTFGLPKKSEGGLWSVPLLARAHSGKKLLGATEKSMDDSQQSGHGSVDQDSIVNLSNCVAIWEHAVALVGPKLGDNVQGAGINTSPMQQCLVGEMNVCVCDQDSQDSQDSQEERESNNNNDNNTSAQDPFAAQNLAVKTTKEFISSTSRMSTSETKVSPLSFCFTQIDYKPDKQPRKIDDSDKNGGGNDDTKSSISAESSATEFNEKATVEEKQYSLKSVTSSDRKSSIKTALLSIIETMRSEDKGGLLIVSAQPSITLAKELKRQKYLAEYGSMGSVIWNMGREKAFRTETALANLACCSFATINNSKK